jgi:uncharacterized protein (DUF58 family)
MLLRILDPAEVNFTFAAASMFQDLETGQEIYVDPQTIAADYRKRFEQHAAVIKECCDDLGIDFFQITTDQPVENSLLELIQARGRRGRRLSRSSQPGGRS